MHKGINSKLFAKWLIRVLFHQYSYRTLVKSNFIFPDTCKASISLNNQIFSIHYGVPNHQAELTDAFVHRMISRDKSTCLGFGLRHTFHRMKSPIPIICVALAKLEKFQA